MSLRYDDPSLFEQEPPPTEIQPLLMVRRSIHRWDQAEAWAAEAAERSRHNPEDARLARCASHLAAEAEACRTLAAGAVQAWSGEASGAFFLRDRNDEPEPPLLRVDFGEVPQLSVVRAGESAFPTASETFDLIEAERALVCRAIRAVEADPVHQELACAAARQAERHPYYHHFGSGGHTPGSIAWIYCNHTAPKQ